MLDIGCCAKFGFGGGFGTGCRRIVSKIGEGAERGERDKPSPAVECSIKVNEKDELIPRPTSGNIHTAQLQCCPCLL